MPNKIIGRLKAASKYLVVVAAVLVFTGWFLTTPPGFFGKVDAIAYAVCHRISERSFHIGNFQLPLCARCTGMYLGAVVGLLFQTIHGPKRSKVPHWTIITVLVLFFVAFGVDGSNSYLYLLRQVQPGFLPQIPNLYVPNNTLRLLTGSGMGLAIAVMIFPAFNQSIWADYDATRSALPGWKSFGLLLGIQIILDLLVLTQNPFVLYPVAVISTLGVWVLLTMVYTIVWVMLMRQDNSFTKIRQLWVPLLAGLTIAILQTGAIDLIRFWLTGTWNGFSLG
ncbi:MAG TPA: DUF2085 domain-containing protein [Anaerolineales bacterium]|nr:DUF2085 domain-containing protein [Anaerolineales bacterium]